MRIAIVAPVEESIPPKKYGGTEWVVYNIAHGLGKKGHQVDLYASADSRQETTYNLIPITSSYLRTDPQLVQNTRMRDVAKLISIANALTPLQTHKYDVINNHASWRLLLFANLLNPKPITVHHMPLSLDYQHAVFAEHADLWHIALSNNQKKDFPDLNFVKTIYNGVQKQEELSKLPKEEYLVFLGRMSENKGAVEAARIAHQLKKKLVVVAKVDEADQEYYQKFKPYIDNHFVEFVGELPHDDGLKIMAKAKALLMPVSYEDPCPLVPLEAMSLGTPVISFARGALPEQIIDGKTGFLINPTANDIRGSWGIQQAGTIGLTGAVNYIFSLSEDKYEQMRQACLRHIEENFSIEKMVDNYEKIFLSFVESR